MKFLPGQAAALCCLLLAQASVVPLSIVDAFAVTKKHLIRVPSGSTALRSTPPDAPLSSSGIQRAPQPPLPNPQASKRNVPMFPFDLPVRRIEGGNTIATWQIPEDAERAQIMIKTTNGRPIKGRVELWIGPIRRTHYNDIDVEDGTQTPLRYILKFKKGHGTIRLNTKTTMEMPMIASVSVCSKERSKELDDFTMNIWENEPKTLIQGGRTEGGGGAIRTFPIPDDVQRVQVLIWSRDTGSKSFKAKIEVLQGPNNLKQTYDLQCAGGSQPFHAVYETPGNGVTLRMYNKKFVEDGLFQTIVIPYDIDDAKLKSPSVAVQKEWWE